MEQLKDYALYQLGYPINVIEIERDTQLEQVIDDTIQLFQRYNTGEGNYLEYLIFNVSAGQASYSLSGYAGAFDIELSMGMDGINTLFSPQHELLYANMTNGGGSMLGLGNGSPDPNPSLIMTNYSIAMTYLKNIKNTFGRSYIVQYNPNSETLVVTPTPTQNATGLLYMYKKASAIELYNNILIKEMVVAKTKILWAMNIGMKYSVTLPDGITVNGKQLYDDGKAEYDRLLAAFKDESEPVGFEIG